MNNSKIPGELEAISAAAARWVTRRDAGLSPVERNELQQWLALDPRHAAALEHYANTWSVFDRPKRVGASEAVLREVGWRGRRRRVRRTLTGLGVGLAALLALGGFRLWSNHLNPATSAKAAAKVVVLRPEQRTLPDGSVVDLKADAEIVVAFSPEFRRVELKRGEVHFQVAKNPARPFVVSARGVEIHAVGTAFAVQLRQEAVEVLVTEGRIAVEEAAPTPVAPTRALEPPATFGAGQLLVIDLERGIDRVPLAAVQPVALDELNERLAWRSPRLEFSGTPLAKAVALMNRTEPARPGASKIRLVLDPKSPELAEEPVSGLFRADNAESFVRILELSLSVRGERRGDEIILHKAR